MNNYQNNVDKLFEQNEEKQQEINNLTSNIIGRNQVELEQLIKTKKQEIENPSYTAEEAMYINSGYYYYYRYIFDNADKLFIELLKEIASNYEKNKLFFIILFIMDYLLQ